MEQSVSKEILSWAKSLIIALLIVWVCRQFLFAPTTVYGESMEPTFSHQDRIIIGKNTSIDRFDVIVFDAPDSEEHYIKRVIGLPGDHIEMKNDILMINGESFEEPYLEKLKEEKLFGHVTGDFSLEELTGEYIVPDDSLFVLGDNRTKSYDSRRFGFITFESIIGEVKFRFYPFNEIGIP